MAYNQQKYLADVQALEVAMKIAVLADDSGNNSTDTTTAATKSGSLLLHSTATKRQRVRNAVEGIGQVAETFWKVSFEGYN